MIWLNSKSNPKYNTIEFIKHDDFHSPVIPPRKSLNTIIAKSNPSIFIDSSSGSLPNQKGNSVDFKVIDGLAIAYGDIILGKLPEDSNLSQGSYDSPPPQYWDKPEIPYAISPDLPHPERIEKALEYFKQHTVVSFIPYENQKDAVIFERGTEHCLSVLGRVGGLQPIKLSDNCQLTEILHEIMHTLGFVHEQSRPDRDKYIQVLWQNIEEKYQSQFAIVPESFFTGSMQDSAFDYQSVMLYQPNAFAVSSDLVTLKSLSSESINPIRDGLSENDIKRVNRLHHW